MHELSLAQELIEQITQAAQREKASRITRVVVLIGSFSGVEPDAFELAFPFAAEGSIAEGAELVIEKNEAQAVCRDCRKQFEPIPALMSCPNCGSDNVELQGGREFLIRSLDIEQN